MQKQEQSSPRIFFQADYLHVAQNWYKAGHQSIQDTKSFLYRSSHFHIRYNCADKINEKEAIWKRRMMSKDAYVLQINDKITNKKNRSSKRKTALIY